MDNEEQNKTVVQIQTQDSNKSKLYIIIGAIIIFTVGVLCYHFYTAGRTDTNYNDVNNTVQSVERGNEQARTDIQSATDRIGSAQEQLNGASTEIDNASGTTEQLQELNNSNAESIKRSEDLIATGRESISRERDIFTEIDRANNITQGTLPEKHEN